VKNQVSKPPQEGVRSTEREVQASTAAWVEQASTAAPVAQARAAALKKHCTVSQMEHQSSCVHYHVAQKRSSPLAPKSTYYLGSSCTPPPCGPCHT
jgi:hypothetical protein